MVKALCIRHAGSNESLCSSNVKLTGTTTVTAKPGQGIALRNMIATMPGTPEILLLNLLLQGWKHSCMAP